ncbi:SEC14-like protein 3 [Rhipicephalus sanguineus]|uniref:SEC14-like protein 3 n=1 Tax=Rhipicephalus sanguineus TaxID=34632 RepID=UPI0020C51213|nr:SEC14-like protein 3 [Rhipicephalus sanguineus]
MSGRVGDLTEQQMTALDELRANVDDILRPSHDDYFLLRWLRARNFNVSQAEAMLRENLQWRKQNNVDTILEDYEPTEVLKKYYPGGLVGHDKEGCPLWIIPFGYTDIKGLFYSVKKSDFIRHIIQQLEYSAQDMAAQTEKRSVTSRGVVLGTTSHADAVGDRRSPRGSLLKTGAPGLGVYGLETLAPSLRPNQDKDVDSPAVGAAELMR